MWSQARPEVVSLRTVWLCDLRCWSVFSERRLGVLSDTGQGHFELVLQLQYGFCFEHALLWSYCEKDCKTCFCLSSKLSLSRC